MADMQKHRVYKLNLNKFGRFMVCLASAIGDVMGMETITEEEVAQDD